MKTNRDIFFTQKEEEIIKKRKQKTKNDGIKIISVEYQKSKIVIEWTMQANKKKIQSQKYDGYFLAIQPQRAKKKHNDQYSRIQTRSG